MSTLRVDNITNEAGSASPNLPNGLSGDVLTSGTVDTARMPAGSVIQVVQEIYTTDTEITTTSFSDVGLQATITPSSVNNKILCMVSPNSRMKSQHNNFRTFSLRLTRNGIAITTKRTRDTIAGTGSFGYFVSNGDKQINYLDSPNTTSPVTYKLQASVSSSADNTGYEFNDGGLGQAEIILMEIVG